MEETVTALDGRSPETDGGSQANKKGGLLERLMSILKRTSGTLLGSIAVSTQIVNVLVCVFGIFVGPAIVVDFFSR